MSRNGCLASLRLRAGLLFPATTVAWKSPRHGRRKRPGDGQHAWSSEQIRPSPAGGLRRRRDHAASASEAAGQAAVRCLRRGALRHELTACLRTRARVADAEGAHSRRGLDLHLSRDHDQPTSNGGGSRSAPCRATGEGDLILGLGSSAIGTLVEAHDALHSAGYTWPAAWRAMATRPGVENGPAPPAGHARRGGDVTHAISRTIVTLPEQLRRSLTWDQGAEMAQHARLQDRGGRASSFLRSSQPVATRHQRGTLTDCCANTSPKGPISACTAPTRLQPWPPPSTRGPERRLIGKHPQRRLTGFSYQPTKIVLRRPL